MLRLSWLLLVASVALSALLQVAVAPASLVGFLTAGATPVWLLGSSAVLTLLYRAEVSADPAAMAAVVSAEQHPASAELEQPGAEALTKRAQAECVYATLSADGAPVSAGQLAAAAGLSNSDARALVAQFHTQPAVLQHNGRRPAPPQPTPSPRRRRDRRGAADTVAAVERARPPSAALLPTCPGS